MILINNLNYCNQELKKEINQVFEVFFNERVFLVEFFFLVVLVFNLSRIKKFKDVDFRYDGKLIKY